MTLALVLAALLCPPAPAQEPVFTSNEVRAAKLRDRLREARAAVADDTDAGKALTARTTEAFRGTDDWTKASESYYGLRRGLRARAAALEKELDAAMALNTSEQAEKAAKGVDAAAKKADVLLSDWEFYVRLPELADGPQRQVAQAAMRLLVQTKDYPMALAFYRSRTSDRRPFGPLSPPATAVRPSN